MSRRPPSCWGSTVPSCTADCRLWGWPSRRIQKLQLRPRPKPERSGCATLRSASVRHPELVEGSPTLSHVLAGALVISSLSRDLFPLSRRSCNGDPSTSLRFQLRQGYVGQVAQDDLSGVQSVKEGCCPSFHRNDRLRVCLQRHGHGRVTGTVRVISRDMSLRLRRQRA